MADPVLVVQGDHAETWHVYPHPTDPGACNDSFGTRAPTSGGSALGSGTTPVDYTRNITGLTPGTYRRKFRIPEYARSRKKPR